MSTSVRDNLLLSSVLVGIRTETSHWAKDSVSATVIFLSYRGQSIMTMAAFAAWASYRGQLVHLGLSAWHNTAQDPPPRQMLGQMATFCFPADTRRMKQLAQVSSNPQLTINIGLYLPVLVSLQMLFIWLLFLFCIA